MLKNILLFIGIFALGFAVSNLFTGIAQAQVQAPSDGGFEFSADSTLGRMLGLGSGSELGSPKDRISEDQILVNSERVYISVDNPQWASFTDTNSMDPVIDAGANAIEIIPQSQDDIEVGDIVAYESEFADGLIIHRVIEKNTDTRGTYFTLKGDNNPTPDPGRVRFSQIKRVVVAIIY